MATPVKPRELTADERRELERLARSRTEEARLVVRARIVLGLADGERPRATGNAGRDRAGDVLRGSGAGVCTTGRVRFRTFRGISAEYQKTRQPLGI